MPQPVLFSGGFKVEDSELQDVDEVFGVQLTVKGVLLKLCEALTSDSVDAPCNKLGQVIRLPRNKQFHAPHFCQQEILTLFLHLSYLIFLDQWQQLVHIGI